MCGSTRNQGAEFAVYQYPLEEVSNPLENYKSSDTTNIYMSKEDDPFGIKQDSEIRQNAIIENRDKLKISHIPDQLEYRQDHINKIVNDLFVEALKGNEGEDAVITGEPGTGKTAVIKYVLNKLDESYDTSNLDYAYINCKTNSSKQEVFRAIMNSLGIDFKRGVGIGENVNKLFKEYRNQEDNSLIIILDEVDELYKARREYINEILYTLSRPDEHSDGFKFEGSLNIVCASNDNKLYEYLDFDVDDSSFSPERLEFLPYSTDQITEILLNRQEQAYSEKILDRKHMKEIAMVVSNKFNGDIRVGIRILKKLPKNIDANTEGIDQTQLVQKAVNDVKRSRIEKVLNGKDKHFLLVMHGMLQNYSAGKSKLDYIVESYRSLCESVGVEKNEDDFNKSDGDSKAKSRSYVRRRLEYLVDENILTKEKRYDKPRNPYFYKPTVDINLFLEMVNERLERKNVGVIEDYDEGASAMSGLNDEEKEKLEKLDEMTS